MREQKEYPAREWKWDDAIENTQEFMDAAIMLSDEESLLTDDADSREFPSPRTSTGKSQFTELRRRIEERLERKRIALEYEYD